MALTDLAEDDIETTWLSQTDGNADDDATDTDDDAADADDDAADADDDATDA